VNRYSPELKEQIVKKMMPPNNQSVAAISREAGIAEATLYAWKKQFRTRGYVVPVKPADPDRWDAKAKLAAVIQTAVMNEAERSAYCREHGLYVEQLDAWKQAFEAMNTPDQAVSKTDLTAVRKKNRRLEKELKRKEKALAETAALLTLSKKAEAIWGADGDD
jgi:transposase-like protein